MPEVLFCKFIILKLVLVISQTSGNKKINVNVTEFKTNNILVFFTELFIVI